jgi:phosphoribosylamine--glycine ligase
MRYLVLTHGSARDHMTFDSLRRRGGDGDEIFYASFARNGLLDDHRHCFVISNIDEAVRLCQDLNIHMAVVFTPELLMEGAVDLLRKNRIHTFGIPRCSTRLEANKQFSKQFMLRAGVPTAPAVHVSDVEEGCALLEARWADGREEFVIKAADFVEYSSYRTVVPRNLDEALVSLRYMLSSGPAHHRSRSALLEKKLIGHEISAHVLVDDEDYILMPWVSDHKNLLADRTGPLTAGMAAYATLSSVDATLEADIRKKIIEPTISELRRSGLEYRFILYIGVMVTDDGPVVLEYNVRPGNPEWIAILSLMKTPLQDVIEAIQRSRLHALKVEFENRHAFASFAVPVGYPTLSHTNCKEAISGLEDVDDDVWLLGEGIVRENGEYRPSGGRTLAIAAAAENAKSAHAKVFSNLRKIRFNGMYYADLRVDDWHLTRPAMRVMAALPT